MDRSVLCHVRVAYVVNCLNRFPALMTSYIVFHLPERRNRTSCSNSDCSWTLWRRYQFRLAGLTCWKTLLGRIASVGLIFYYYLLQEKDYVKHKQKKTYEQRNMSRIFMIVFCCCSAKNVGVQYYVQIVRVNRSEFRLGQRRPIVPYRSFSLASWKLSATK